MQHLERIIDIAAVSKDSTGVPASLSDKNLEGFSCYGSVGNETTKANSS